MSRLRLATAIHDAFGVATTVVLADGFLQTAICLLGNKFSFKARPRLNPLPLPGEDFH